LSALGLIALPNASIAAALLFSIATLSRRAMMSYLGALSLAGLSVFNWLYLAQVQGQWRVARLLDPSVAQHWVNW
jgi:hypothetical protein